MTAATVIGILIFAVMAGILLRDVVKACRRDGRPWWKAALAALCLLAALAGFVAANVLLNKAWPSRPMLIRIGL